MTYNVSVSARAYNDIDRHVAFLSNVSINAAEKLQGKFISSMKSLEKNALSYPVLVLNKENTKYRKLFVPKRYLILYEVEDNNIFVDYVVDCRQDYAWLLE